VSSLARIVDERLVEVVARKRRAEQNGRAGRGEAVGRRRIEFDG
jgi:hypothetical protein